MTIFWKEKVEQAIIFEDIDGITQIDDIKGVGIEPNPTLLSRTSFAHILTLINNETANHRFHIDVFNVQTDLLEPGDQEIITIYLDKKGEFTYSDKRQNKVPPCKIKIVSVVPSDEFQGIWRDLI